MASFAVARRRDNGLELLWKSGQGFEDMLYSFRECHDLCIASQLFGGDIISAVDQCAVDFRALSLDSVSVAKRVSSQWLDTALVIFENLEDIENPKDMLELLGTQARELVYCFRVIAAWASELRGRFHQAQDGTIKEAQEFEGVFEKDMEDRKDVVDMLKQKRHSISKSREQHQQSVSSLKSNLKNVKDEASEIRDVMQNKLLRSAEQKLSEARKQEQKVDDDIQKAEERVSQNHRATPITKKVCQLVKMLENVETTSKDIANYWSTEAESFESQCDKKASSDSVRDKIAAWTKAKEEIDRYVMKMSKVNNMFNFETEAKPTEAKQVQCENLDITLRVPKSVTFTI